MHFDDSFSRMYVHHLAMEAASELKRLWRERGGREEMRYSLKGRVYDDLAYVSTNVRWDLNVRFLEELYLRSDIT